MIIIISILVWTGSFLHPPDPTGQGFSERPMPLYSILTGLPHIGPLVYAFAGFILVLLLSYLLVNFNTADLFLGERTFLPALFFILLSGIFVTQQTMNPVLPAAILLLVASVRIMDSYKVQGVAYSFFDAGLLIGIGSMFYFNFLWFGLLLIIGIALLRTGSFREIMISVLGVATPLFLLYGVLYIAGKDFGKLAADANYNLFGEADPHKFSVTELIALITAGIILLVSLLHLLIYPGGKKIKSRKTLSLMIWTLLLALTLYFVSRSVSTEMFWIAAIPASYIMSHYFIHARRKLIPEILFVSLFAAVAAVQILNLI